MKKSKKKVTYKPTDFYLEAEPYMEQDGDEKFVLNHITVGMFIKAIKKFHVPMDYEMQDLYDKALPTSRAIECIYSGGQKSLCVALKDDSEEIWKDIKDLQRMHLHNKKIRARKKKAEEK